MVFIEVSDNGSGLPKVPYEQLFDPFFSTKKPMEGTGLGLAIVKMLLDRFGASIDVKETSGGGATFIISFDEVKSGMV